ncbi:MAG: MarR family transcriptional regulator [Candidatus Dormibacteraeota bacterium]|nr:MarR family transcriptional regulator [Candidatus Dormibacteraeota bacterium]
MTKIITMQPPASQDGAGDPGGHLLATVRRLASDVVDAHQRHAELLGVSSTELRSLELVAAEGQTTAGRLASALRLTTGAVTGILDRLEQRGLVRRKPDPEDRRRVLVVLGEGASAQLAGVPDPLAAGVGDLLAVSDPDRLATVDRLLSVLDLSLRDELRRLDQRHPSPGGGEPLAVGGAGVSQARLRITAGLNNVTLGTASMEELCQVAFGGNAEVELVESGGTVTLGPRRRLLLGGWVGPGEITLRAGLRWALEVAGGSNRWTADLSGATVDSVTLQGGANRIGIVLPAPEGTVPVTIGGGVSRCTLRVPAGSALRLTTRGGATKLRIGEVRMGAVGGRLEWQSPDYAGTPDRYDVSVGGGADRLEILEESPS